MVTITTIRMAICSVEEDAEALKHKDEGIAQDENKNKHLFSHREGRDVPPDVRFKDWLQHHKAQAKEEGYDEPNEGHALGEYEQDTREHEAPGVIDKTPPIPVCAVLGPQDLRRR
eukprot:scaffold286661_cov26-Tisochrysis_lutea.AAC.6